MALFIESEIRQRAKAEVQKRGTLRKADQLIVEASAQFSATRAYDVFLSHSVRDGELVLGMKSTLEDLGLSVYVDWIEDPQLDRSRVTAATAEGLRQRMQASRSLFFLTTPNAAVSKWMPWECGYFDGTKEKVAVAPVLPTSSDDSFAGQEYLGLYPYVLKANDRARLPTLWVHKSKTEYISYKHWVATPNASIVWLKQ